MVDIAGLDNLRPIIPPQPPQCDARTPPKWYRPDGGRCPWRAKYSTADGRLLCALHAKMEPSLNCDSGKADG